MHLVGFTIEIYHDAGPMYVKYWPTVGKVIMKDKYNMFPCYFTKHYD